MTGDWREQASCNGDPDPDAWFASPLSEPGRAARAASICCACPVQENCLDFALGIDADFGIWAGMTARDLRDLGAVQRRTDDWAEEGVRADKRARQRSEKEWGKSLGTRGHQRMTG